MSIAIRREHGGWNVLRKRRYVNEAQLQELLSHAPSLIPLNDISDDLLPPLVAVRELPLGGSGSLDLLAVDRKGHVNLVECKLDSNPESKRTVVAQILEYASALWKMTYETLNVKIRNRLGTGLAELVRSRLSADEADDWTQEDFESQVATELASGAFRLIIAVDEVNDRLRSMVEYLNETSSGFTIHLLEIDFYREESSTTEVLVGRFHGTARPAAGGAVAKTSRAAFLDKCDDAGRAFFEPILSYGEASPGKLEWGTQGFSYRIDVDGNRHSVLEGYPADSGTGQKIRILRGELTNVLPPATYRTFYDSIVRLLELPNPDTEERRKIPVAIAAPMGREHADRLIAALERLHDGLPDGA